MSFSAAANASFDPFNSKIIEPARTSEHAISRAPLDDSLFVHSFKNPALLLPTTSLKLPASTTVTTAAFGGCVVASLSRAGAFVAGFVRVFNLHKPGMAKMPVLPTSFVAISAKLSMTFEHTDFLSSHEVASASAIAPFDIGLPAVFMVFMGAIFLRDAL